LKQAPRAWYERLRDFLLSNGFKIGKVDTTLFTKKIGNDIFICQIYVDDIIFGSTNEDFCKEFGEMMSKEFEMSMIGELSFFLGLQIKQLKEGTFVCQSKYVRDILKKFGMEDAKLIKTPMATNGHLDLDEGGKPVDLKLYRSMIGSLLYLTASRPLGQIDLPIWFGTPDNYREETLTFEVVGFRGAYHAILGRPCYAKFMAVPNYTYLKMKMSGPNSVITVGSSIEHAFDCDVECVEHAEALALDEALVANVEKMVNEDLDSAAKHAGSFEAAEQTKEVPLDPAAPEGKALRVNSTLDPK
jgi:hypothetical protein